MIRYAAFACLALAGCAPEAKPPEMPAPAEQVMPEVAPIADATDAAKYKPAPDGEITVATPLAGARVTSPLIAEGVAINTWFFEGQFVAELVVDGEVIAQAPAMQAGSTSWVDPGPVQFRAELAFNVTQEQNAELILSEDMPEMINPDTDERGPARSVRIPVVLVPPAK
ncbi:MAG: Gmad2 immunoglobulin-like domain-containing protein [Hyphomonadaceae bacterium]|nr:Gmad2 immunoglobulin-like domain-containing protein [Hyphomonadaceae bacterium]